MCSDAKAGVRSVEGRVEYVYPEGMLRSPAYTLAVVVSGNVKTIYVGGTNAVDDRGP